MFHKIVTSTFQILILIYMKEFRECFNQFVWMKSLTLQFFSYTEVVWIEILKVASDTGITKSLEICSLWRSQRNVPNKEGEITNGEWEIIPVAINFGGHFAWEIYTSPEMGIWGNCYWLYSSLIPLNKAL